MARYRGVPLRQMTKQELDSEIRRLKRSIDRHSALLAKSRTIGERELTQKKRNRSMDKLLQRLRLAETYREELIK